MPITDVTVPYEILIRFGPDGKVQGAHVQNRRIVRDGDTVLADMPLDAEPLDISKDFPASEVLGDTLTAALSQLNAVQAKLAQVEQVEFALADAVLREQDMREELTKLREDSTRKVDAERLVISDRLSRQG